MLKFYNTLTRKIEEFKPIDPKEVRMYACGPTVYNYAHIGNLRTYIFEDLLRRVLEYNGYKVNHAMNITDVGHLVGDGDEGEDKLEVSAKKEHKDPWEITKFYSDEFFKDCADLNMLHPSSVIKASDTILEEIEIIKILEEKGFTYKGENAIYFDVSKFSDYGKLSGQKLDEKKVGARDEVVVDKEKKHPADFALWFFLVGRHKNHVMHWHSPWGEGFPGWHIECSAISRKLLGQPFDIHCGGIDLIMPHHTNEIAQSEAAFGVPLAKYWMHGEFLNISPLLNIHLKDNTHICPYCSFPNLVKDKFEYIQKNEPDGVLLMVKCKQCQRLFSGSIKMAKSGDNFITLDKLKEKSFSPLDYRYLCLTAHYRTQLNFTWEALEAAHEAYDRLSAYISSRQERSGLCQDYEDKFIKVINDDLNIPQALSLVWELISEKKYGWPEKINTILKWDKIFGLNLEYANPFGDTHDPEINKLILERQKARTQKDFKKSDELRKQIEDLGYEIMDTPEGPKIKKKPKI